MSSTPKGHWAGFGDNLEYHDLRDNATAISGQGCCPTSPVYSTTPTTKNHPSPNVTSAKVENPHPRRRAAAQSKGVVLKMELRGELQ